MRLEIAIVLPCLVAGAVAEPYKIDGSVSNFEAEPLSDDKQWTAEIYGNCRQYYDNHFISKGPPCVSELLMATLTALTIARHVDPGVILVNEDIGLETKPKLETNSTSTTSTLAVKPSQSADLDSYGATFERGDGIQKDILLGRINSYNWRQSDDAHMVRAVQVGHSMVHPRDGISVRTNVHSDDNILHVHTNGSHATAMFEKTTLSQKKRRDEVSAPKMQFKFGNDVEGFKVQTKWASDDQQKRYVSSSDLNFFTTAFGHGDGQNDPAFMKSNSWKFIVCNTTEKVKLFQGKFISLEHASDYSYEEEKDMDCT
jgi:hypothetical protein